MSQTLISSALKYFRAFRLAEAFILTGFFIIGSAFAIEKLTTSSFLNLFFVFCAAFCLISSLWAFNALCGKKYDAANERLSFLSSISNLHYVAYFVVLLGISFLIAFRLNPQMVYYIAALALIGTVYSLPVIGPKNKPFIGTVFHFFFQIISFNASFIVFAPLSIDSVLISVYFALLFSAGHMHHEVIDYESDKKTKLRTGAIFLGLLRAEYFSFILFSIAAAFWVLLYFRGGIDNLSFTIFISAYLLQAIAFFKSRDKFVEHLQSRISYRTLYRTFYFIAGCILLTSKLLPLL